MSAVPILGALAFAGAVVAWVTWHRTADERQSVQHHQHALETLRNVADRSEPAPIRRGEARPAAAGRAIPSAAPPARAVVRRRPPPPVRGRPVASGPARRPGSPPVADTKGPKTPKKGAPSAAHPTMVFVDDSAPPSALTTPVTALRPGQDVSGRGGGRVAGPRRIGRMRRRSALVAVASALVVAAVIGSLLSGSPPARPHVPLAPARHTAGERHDGGGRSPTLSTTPSSDTPSSTATSTTSPTSALAPTVTGAQSATYAAPAASYTVGLAASGQCWVMAQAVASGQVLWTGTLNTGDSRSLSASGTVRLELGAASDVVVTLDGKPVQLPAGFQSPFAVTFAA